jgi:hypothetical protein
MTPRAKVAAGYGGILLWMFLPMFPVVMASLIASVCGCKLDEGSAHTCIVLGMDIGGMLYSMGVMGWFGLLTVPSGFLLLVVFTVMIIKERKLKGL